MNKPPRPKLPLSFYSAASLTGWGQAGPSQPESGWLLSVSESLRLAMLLPAARAVTADLTCGDAPLYLHLTL
jgi:hypothetical protein